MSYQLTSTEEASKPPQLTLVRALAEDREIRISRWIEEASIGRAEGVGSINCVPGDVPVVNAESERVADVLAVVAFGSQRRENLSVHVLIEQDGYLRIRRCRHSTSAGVTASASSMRRVRRRRTVAIFPGCSW
ncbi:MAG: hypothetical protein V5A27_08400 [Halapricum sp.]